MPLPFHFLNMRFLKSAFDILTLAGDVSESLLPLALALSLSVANVAAIVEEEEEGAGAFFCKDLGTRDT